MLQNLWGLPDQCTEALRIARNFNPSFTGSDIDAIVIAGQGGSAIGGDLLRVFLAGRARIPVVVNRDYILPVFVSERTLVFVSSYSGNTEETLSIYDEARSRGAKIIALTSGGKLKAMAERDKAPVIIVPGGVAPRAATGYLLLPPLMTLAKLGIIEDITGEIDGMIELLRELREQFKPVAPVEKNLAKQLAHKLFNKVPLIWGACGAAEVAALRWKDQLNENSKSPAFWNFFSELNHNEIVGFENTASQLLPQLEVIILRNQTDHPRIQQRMEITKSVIRDRVSGITEVWSTGASLPARTFSLIYTGDYASVYLALLYGIDPTPVWTIDLLKNELAKKG